MKKEDVLNVTIHQHMVILTRNQTCTCLDCLLKAFSTQMDCPQTHFSSLIDQPTQLITITHIFTPFISRIHPYTRARTRDVIPGLPRRTTLQLEDQIRLTKQREDAPGYSAVVCCVLFSGGVALLMVALILGKAEVVFDCEGCKPSWAAAVF